MVSEQRGSHDFRVFIPCNVQSQIKELKRRKSKSQEKIELKISRSKNTQLMRQPTAKEPQEAMTVIIRAVQSECFSEELKSERRIAESNKLETVTKSSKLYRLDPFADNNGVLRVGGRLRCANLEFREKYPVLMPIEKQRCRSDNTSLPQSDQARCHPPS